MNNKIKYAPPPKKKAYWQVCLIYYQYMKLDKTGNLSIIFGMKQKSCIKVSSFHLIIHNLRHLEHHGQT